MSKDGTLWSGLESPDLLDKVIALEPEQRRITANEDAIDNICQAFAEVIDAKSPFTYRHSTGVAEASMDIARWFGMKPRDLKLLRRAALLHDLGKLSVPNMILEKPGKLTDEEWIVVKKHPYYTLEILRRIPGFEALGEEAAAHHEKLDGSGYWRGLAAEQLSTFARILAVADIFDALRAKRPYRDSTPLDKTFSILRAEAPRALDLPCIEALIAAKSSSEPSDLERQGFTPVQQQFKKGESLDETTIAIGFGACWLHAAGVFGIRAKLLLEYRERPFASPGRNLCDVVKRCRGRVGGKPRRAHLLDGPHAGRQRQPGAAARFLQQLGEHLGPDEPDSWRDSLWGIRDAHSPLALQLWSGICARPCVGLRLALRGCARHGGSDVWIAGTEVGDPCGTRHRRLGRGGKSEAFAGVHVGSRLQLEHPGCALRFPTAAGAAGREDIIGPAYDGLRLEWKRGRGDSSQPRGGTGAGLEIEHDNSQQRHGQR